jgi:predicted ATP-grasp superfamily ATP-dependent carboligase
MLTAAFLANDFLPQDVASPTDLRAALESFEDMDIKVLEEVPTEGAEGEIDAEAEKEAEEETADAAGDSSDIAIRIEPREERVLRKLHKESQRSRRMGNPSTILLGRVSIRTRWSTV